MKKIRAVSAWILTSRKRKIIAGLTIILVLSSLYYVLSIREENKTAYQTAKVEKGTIVSTVSASGKVISSGIISITTEATGLVGKVFIKDGDKVAVGQKLAEITLDQAGLERNASAYASYVSAQNSINSANNGLRSAIASAEKVLDEVKGHDTDETLTQKETRTKAEVARDNAYDAVKSAQANFTTASLNLRAASPIITTPFSGVVESVGLVEGMVLESTSTDVAATSVAVIKRNTSPIVSVTLSEVDILKVKVGQKVTITFDSLSDKTFTGIVATVDRLGTVSSNVTSYGAKIKLDSAVAEILPNMAATANIILETKADVLLVPTTSVTSQNGQNYARVLKNGLETQVAVEVGISSDSDIEIISGLSEGDEVITGTVSAGTSSTRTRSIFSQGFGAGGEVRIPR